ncbi:MAG: hypothetical protein U9Q69_00750 [Nanoarchaeota archaeon]|nr:hypothetical protein [Nanoarchaeota archaeon]
MQTLRNKLIEETKEKMHQSFNSEKLIITAAKFIIDLENCINKLKLRLKNWSAFYNDNEDIFNLDFKECDCDNLKKEDLKIVKRNIAILKNLIKMKKENLAYLTRIMNSEIPTFTKVTGSLLGASIINLAGGIKKLAMMASSKIQVLGAEKALFRHLKAGTKPPKYGIIFYHPQIQNSTNKGQAARKLSAQISKAIRLDYFRK